MRSFPIATPKTSRSPRAPHLWPSIETALGQSRYLILLASPEAARAAAIHGMPIEDLLSQEVRQQRRALMLAWSTAGTLLVLLGLALWLGYEANVQRGIAVAQRDRAERTLTAATNTAHSLVFDLAQRFRYVSNVPASLVRDILDRALKLQDQLSSAGESSLDLPNHASWRGRLGQLRLWDAPKRPYTLDMRFADMRFAQVFVGIVALRALPAAANETDLFRELSSE